MALTQNTFSGDFNMDTSDFMLKNDMLRNCQNMRIVSLEGMTFAASNIRGNTKTGTSDGDEFRLTQGYYPLAAKDYGGILYIISGIFLGGKIENVELGTYPSPNYEGSDINTDIWKYRPLNNLDSGAFRVSGLWEFDYDSFVDLELQPKYDGSINYIITIKGNHPRLINSAFSFQDGKFAIVPDVGYAGIQTDYDLTSLDKDTRLIMISDKILHVELDGIYSGGKLKPGNYQYVFAYQDENFNETDVVGESMTCAVTFGNVNSNDVKGGDENEETNKKVRLTLTNIDKSYRYIQVYFKYSSGRESTYTGLFKLNKPYAIQGVTTNTFTFEHTGYEDTEEIAPETINVDYSAISSASTLCQIKNYLMLGDITQTIYDWTEYARIAKTAKVTLVTHTHINKEPFKDPHTVYHYMSEMRGETIPYGIIFIMRDGSKSPVLPILGYDYTKGVSTDPSVIEKGLIRFPELLDVPITNNIGNPVSIGINVNFTSIASDDKDFLLENTLGYFVVRGERRADALIQGYLIPTFKAPGYEAADWKNVPYDNMLSEDGYGAAPILDGILEPYMYMDRDGTSNDNPEDFDIWYSVSNVGSYERSMIATLADEFVGQYGDYTTFRTYNRDKWAFYSTDSLLNEPEFITYLQRDIVGIKQYGKVIFNPEVFSPIQFEGFRDAGDGAPPHIPNDGKGTRTAVYYRFGDYDLYTATPPNPVSAKVDYVPGEAMASINNFVSKIWMVLRHWIVENGSGNEDVDDRWEKSFYVYQSYNSFFGVTTQSLLDDTEPGDNNPIGAQSRESSGGVSTFYRNGKIMIDTPNDDNKKSWVNGDIYENSTLFPKAAFLINIYPSDTGIIDNPSNYYTSIDTVTYHRATQTLQWNGDVNEDIDVFAGDTYISRTVTKLYQPGPEFRDALEVDGEEKFDVVHRRNVSMGIMMELLHESKYNPVMRIPYQFDESEREERTFFPYRTFGDALEYRNYKYPDTSRCTIGSSVLAPPKVNFTLPELAPIFKYEYFTRIAHSKRHELNAYGNNYRIFEGINYKDYDIAMGRIIKLIEYRDNLIIVFEHGIGMAPIEQRIQTGSDVAGGIFIEPQDVLPPYLGFASKEIGSQDPYSVIRTPGAVYGFDIERRKIWQLTDGLKVISDTGFQSFLAKHIDTKAVSNRVITGYDPEYHEVMFTYVEFNEYDQIIPEHTWTLVYKEGLEQFRYFYTGIPHFYARRRNEFYQFGNMKGSISMPFLAYKQNNPDSNLLFGNLEDAFIEFVINENPNITKVLDYINIISNEVAPSMIELYTYNKDVIKDLGIVDETKTFQYIKLVDDGSLDIYTDEPIFKLRDRKYVIQIPTVQRMAEDVNERWETDGRLRNKAIIVRLTYNTTEIVELLSVITNYRRSVS